MKQYLNLIKEILDHGNNRNDRTGIGTKSLFGRQLIFKMKDGFPAITTKKLAFKAVKTELIWFLKGGHDLEFLHENNFTFGTPMLELIIGNRKLNTKEI